MSEDEVIGIDVRRSEKDSIYTLDKSRQNIHREIAWASIQNISLKHLDPVNWKR